MEENRIFAFDIDGTLLGYNAEVKRNMDKLFQAIFKKYKNPQIMFVSGGDTLKVDRSVKIMEKVAGVDLSSAIQVSHSGGYIRGENNKTYREDFFFKPDLVQKIINEIFSVDKYFYVVFCTSEGCFFPNYLLNDPTGDWLSVEVTKDIMYKVGNGFVADVASNEQIRALVNENKIRSILALNPKKEFNEIAGERIRKYIAEFPQMGVASGSVIDLTASTKVSAIEAVLKEQKSRVVFFGDSQNDIEALTKGTTGEYLGGVALGNDIETLKSAELALPYMNDFGIAYALGELTDNSVCEIEVDGKIHKIKGKTKEETIKLAKEFTLKISQK
ncbi:MAG: HAD hydrolase family protein [Clostridia bacterium]|nr:HAD hydrolase family protein [Clostridia bacterium]